MLKGATVFAIWGTAYRPTRDLDFTGYGSSDPEDVDQLAFDTETIAAEPMLVVAEKLHARGPASVFSGEATT